MENQNYSCKHGCVNICAGILCGGTPQARGGVQSRHAGLSSCSRSHVLSIPLRICGESSLAVVESTRVGYCVHRCLCWARLTTIGQPGWLWQRYKFKPTTFLSLGKGVHFIRRQWFSLFVVGELVQNGSITGPQRERERSLGKLSLLWR